MHPHHFRPHKVVALILLICLLVQSLLIPVQAGAVPATARTPLDAPVAASPGVPVPPAPAPLAAAAAASVTTAARTPAEPPPMPGPVAAPLAASLTRETGIKPTVTPPSDAIKITTYPSTSTSFYSNANPERHCYLFWIEQLWVQEGQPIRSGGYQFEYGVGHHISIGTDQFGTFIVYGSWDILERGPDGYMAFAGSTVYLKRVLSIPGHPERDVDCNPTGNPHPEPYGQQPSSCPSSKDNVTNNAVQLPNFAEQVVVPCLSIGGPIRPVNFWVRWTSDTHYQKLGSPGTGKGWTYAYTQAITDTTKPPPCSASVCTGGYEEKTLYRPDGAPITFYGPPGANGRYRSLPGNYATLTKLSDGSFELRYASGDRELFDSGGNLTRTEDRLGNATTIAWSVANSIGTLKITDGRTGQCLLAEHQQKPDPDFGTVWRLMLVKDCATNGGTARQVTFSYGTSGNDLNRLVKITDAGGRVQQVRYDALGRIVTRFNPSNNPDVTATAPATQISYAHATGRTWIVARETQLNGATVDFREVTGQAWNAEITYKNAAGTMSRVERFTRDGAGRLLRVYTRNSTTDYTAMTYDAAGNLTSVVDPEGRKTEYVYNAAGHMTEARAYYTGTSTYDATTMQYDSYGNLTQLTEPEGAVTRWRYNATTGLLETVAQVSASETLTTTISYDPVTINGVAVQAGLPTKVTLPDGTQHRFAYDSRGYPATTTYDLDRTGHTGLKLTESFEYDWRGVLLASTNLQGIRTEYEYTQNPSLGQFGALGWPSAAVLDKPTSGTGRQVRTAYTYDAVGNLTKLVADAGDATKRNATTAWTYAVVGSRGTYAPTQETDAVGQVTRYSYDVMGDIYQVEQPNAHNVTNGLITTYTHDERGWLVAVERNSTPYQRIHYNKAGQVTFVSDALDRLTAYAYDAKGRLETVQPHYGVDSATSTYDYDKNDRLTTVTDPRSRVTTYTYDAFNRVKDVTNGAGDLTSYRYDNRHRLTLVTAGDNVDAEQIQVQYTYDAVDRPTKTIVNPGGLNLTTQYSYVATGNSDRWTLKHVIDPKGSVSTRTYNSLGLLASIYDSSHLSTAGYWQYAYTNLGVLSTITPPTGAPTSYESDNLGRITKLTRNGQSESWVYNQGDTVRTFTDFAGQVTSHTYDAYGRLTARDAAGTTADATYTYEANDLLKTATSTPGSSGQLVTTFKYDSRNTLEQVLRGTTVMASYTYNLADEQTGITHGGQTTTYDYDGAGRLKTVNAWSGGASTTTYTAAGLPKLTTRPNGVSTAYEYDAAGRQKRIYHHKGTASLNDIRYDYDRNGNRTVMDDQFGRTTYAYDGLNRLIGARYPAIPNGPAASSEAFRYDAVGNRTFRGDNLAPQAATVTASTQANTTTSAASNARDGGWGTANGEWASTETNPWIQLTWSSARSIDRISLFDRVDANNANGGTLTFSDGSSIVVNTIPTNGAPKDVTFPAKSVTWVKFQVSGGSGANVGLSEIQAFQGATTLTYDASDRIAPGQGYEYDNTTTGTTTKNGNLTKDAQGNTYAYDSLNRLTETGVGGTRTAYTYDALDTMYQQGATTLSYDLTAPYSQLIGEKFASGTQRHYAYGVGGVYAQREVASTAGATQSPLGNHQGSLTNLTDSAGGLLASTGYAAHGQARGSSLLPSGLGAHAEHELAGGTLLNLRARALHKDSGRFLQRDSLDTTALARHAPVGANRYAAMNNNPVNKVDPSGFTAEDPANWNEFYAGMATGAIDDVLAPMESGVGGSLRGVARRWMTDRLLDAVGIDRCNESYGWGTTVGGSLAGIVGGIGGLGKTALARGLKRLVPRRSVADFMEDALRRTQAAKLNDPLGLKLRMSLTPDGKLHGTGPVKGTLEISARTKSSRALRHYNPRPQQGRGPEYVYDPDSNTFIVGFPATRKPNSAGWSPHQKLASWAGIFEKPRLVGGHFSRFPDGSIRTSEFSGHYHQNWTPEIREQFVDFLSREAGVPVHHQY